MLTRRDFAGFASCAICAVTGCVATGTSAAEGASTAVTPRVTVQDALSGNRWRRVAHLPIVKTHDAVHYQLGCDPQGNGFKSQ